MIDWKLIGEILGVLGAVVTSGRWLMGFYFVKAHELENLKAAQRNKIEDALATDINNLKGTIVVFRQELNDFKIKMAEHNAHLNEFEAVTKVVQAQWEKTATHLQERYQSLEGSEVVKVGKDTFIFKTRRGPL
jgi:hypothetical protein